LRVTPYSCLTQRLAAYFWTRALKLYDRLVFNLFQYKDAIEYLKSLKGSLPELEWNESLMKDAEDHLRDIGPKGLLSHTGSDKSNYKQRIE
jgi:hypothetical protein